MKESIEQIDLNFTNAGQGHSASVTTVEDAKNLDGSDGLGTVIGEFGEINEFSNEDVNRAMQNFVCINKTVTATPSKTSINRAYIDKTSLTLNSLIVLVRGLNAAPEGDKDFERAVAYYSEVINSPLNSFASRDPVRKEHVIYAGRIYNYETAAQFNGAKISLVYQNKQLKENLSLNAGEVSPNYKGIELPQGGFFGGPDLAQYDLKFGYTLKEFKKIIDLAGLTINGLPTDNGDDILFELSGTLSSVLAGIASYLGFFYYINPENGFIEFVNTDSISQTKLTDYTKTEDKDIVQASFTRSALTNKIVNTYVGSAEKPEDKSPKDDERTRATFFKRIFLNRRMEENLVLTKQEIGLFFTLFNLGLEGDLFDKLMFCVLIMNKQGNFNFPIDYAPLYDETIKENPPVKYDFVGPIPASRIHGDEEFVSVKEAAEKTNLKDGAKKLNRIEDKFKYFKLSNLENKMLERPSGSKLFKVLQAYFRIAGGVFISNAYGRYKAERMEFLNTNSMNVCGPFHRDDKLSEHSELDSISDALSTMSLNPDEITIRDLANLTGGNVRNSKAVGIGKFHFIGIRTIPSLEKSHKLIGENAQQRFEDLKDFTEFYKPLMVKNPNGQQVEYFGGYGLKFMNGFEAQVSGIVRLSLQAYKAIVEGDEFNGGQVKIKISYRRGKTRVNPIGDDGEAAEDDEIAESSEGSQQNSDLFDRFDLKFFATDSPQKYDQLTQITHSAASGSTIDMKLLRQIRGSMFSDDVVPESSSRVVYGLKIPQYTPTLNSISISVGSNGIRTTINESTISLIPPDQTLLLDRAHEAILTKDGLRGSLSAKQLNSLGL